MIDLPEAYPLKWPDGVRRTPSSRRVRARFSRRQTTQHTWTDYSGKTQSSTRTSAKEVSVTEAIGSEEAMTRLNRAMDAAKVELGRFDKGATR